jgi:hypothetical protein
MTVEALSPWVITLGFAKMALGALNNFLDELGVTPTTKKVVLLVGDLVLSVLFVLLVALNITAMLGWASNGDLQDKVLTMLFFAALAGGWEFLGIKFTQNVLPAAAQAVGR